MPPPALPKALLFDIGGVCVQSPMQTILDYETSHSIPPGWVNYTISRAGPSGAWAQIERGEVPMDANFFAAFNRDLSRPALWRRFYLEQQAAGNVAKGGAVPPVPEIDGEALYWAMMGAAREPDPAMWPALRRLKKDGRFLLAALSNTSIFPEGHPLSEPPPEEKDVTGVFEVFVSSAHVGVRKPDRAAYEVAMEWMREAMGRRGEGLEPGEVVFLDDIGANLKAGREFGFRTVKVKLGDTRAAVRELERITGASLLEGEAKL